MLCPNVIPRQSLILIWYCLINYTIDTRKWRWSSIRGPSRHTAPLKSSSSRYESCFNVSQVSDHDVIQVEFRPIDGRRVLILWRVVVNVGCGYQNKGERLGEGRIWLQQMSFRHFYLGCFYLDEFDLSRLLILWYETKESVIWVALRSVEKRNSITLAGANRLRRLLEIRWHGLPYGVRRFSVRILYIWWRQR